MSILLSVLGIGSVAAIGFFVVQKSIQSRRIYHFHNDVEVE